VVVNQNESTSKFPRCQCIVCRWAHLVGQGPIEGDCPRAGLHGELATALAIMYFGDDRPFVELGFKLATGGVLRPARDTRGES